MCIIWHLWNNQCVALIIHWCQVIFDAFQHAKSQLQEEFRRLTRSDEQEWKSVLYIRVVVHSEQNERVSSKMKGKGLCLKEER